MSVLPLLRRPAIALPRLVRSPVVHRRLESTTAANLRRPVNKLRNGLLGTAVVATVGFSYYYLTDTRSAIHRYQVVPFMRWIYNGNDVPKSQGGRGDGAEKAHEIGLKVLRGLYDIGLPLRERGAHDYLRTGGMGVEVCTATTGPGQLLRPSC